MDKLPAPPTSPFGVSGISVSHPEKIEGAKELGIDQIFVEIRSSDIVNKLGMIESGKIQRFFDEAKRQGIHVFIGITASDPWWRINHWAYTSVVKEVARRANDAVIGYSFGPIDPSDKLQRDCVSTLANAVYQVRPDVDLVVEASAIDPVAIPDLLQLAPPSQWSAIAVPLMDKRETDLQELSSFVSINPLPTWSWRAGGPNVQEEEMATDGENMRQVVYRSVQAISAGAQKVFWAQLEDPKEGIGLYDHAGKRMKPSYRSYNVMVERLWPYISMQSIQEGPDVWAYKFHQLDNQETTVVWSRMGVYDKSWKSHMKGTYIIGDVCGSLCNSPGGQLINPEPQYYIENYNSAYKKPTHHGEHLTGDERKFPYERCSFPSSAEAEKAIIQSGWDWSLPSHVKAEEQSGYFNFNEEPSDDIRVIGWHPKWKDWHIGPGQYDFSSLDKKLNEAHQQHFKVGIRLQSVNKQNVPQWIIDEYHPAQATIPGPLQLRIVAPWDENVRREFEEFVREFGRRGYANDPAFVFASIHGISEATGEEFGLAPGTIKIMEEEAGLTPESLRAWVLGRINAWADAFGENTYKLAWVGSSSFGGGQYNEAARQAVNLCIERGIGGRGGFIEMYNYKFNEALMGQKLDPSGYLTVDESRFANNPYMADENEEYISVKRWRFGLLEEDLSRWRLSMLRALQMRCNFISTNPMSMDLDRQLAEYARLSFGKTIENTPDCWSYLREGYVKFGPAGKSPIKNFERWMIQRDLPGGMTKPANRLERTYAMTTDPEGMHYEFNARRTDCASNNNYIYFDVDDRFRCDDGALVKITYLDNSAARWSVEYMDNHGEASTDVVEGENNGEIKTATFYLPHIQLENELPHQQDLRIACQGPEDVTVMFVRVIRRR